MLDSPVRVDTAGDSGRGGRCGVSSRSLRGEVGSSAVSSSRCCSRGVVFCVRRSLLTSRDLGNPGGESGIGDRGRTGRDWRFGRCDIGTSGAGGGRPADRCDGWMLPVGRGGSCGVKSSGGTARALAIPGVYEGERCGGSDGERPSLGLRDREPEGRAGGPIGPRVDACDAALARGDPYSVGEMGDGALEGVGAMARS